MMDLDGRTTDAHTIAIHAMLNDLRELLNLATIGWGAATVALVVNAVTSLVDHEWVAGGIPVTLAVFTGWSTVDFRRRARKYRTSR